MTSINPMSGLGDIRSMFPKREPKPWQEPVLPMPLKLRPESLRLLGEHKGKRYFDVPAQRHLGELVPDRLLVDDERQLSHKPFSVVADAAGERYQPYTMVAPGTFALDSGAATRNRRSWARTVRAQAARPADDLTPYKDRKWRPWAFCSGPADMVKRAEAKAGIRLSERDGKLVRVYPGGKPRGHWAQAIDAAEPLLLEHFRSNGKAMCADLCGLPAVTVSDGRPWSGSCDMSGDTSAKKGGKS